MKNNGRNLSEMMYYKSVFIYPCMLKYNKVKHNIIYIVFKLVYTLV